MTEPQRLMILQTPANDDKAWGADSSNDYEAFQKDRQSLRLHGPLLKCTFRRQKTLSDGL